WCSSVVKGRRLGNRLSRQCGVRGCFWTCQQPNAPWCSTRVPGRHRCGELGQHAPRSGCGPRSWATRLCPLLQHSCLHGTAQERHVGAVCALPFPGGQVSEVPPRESSTASAVLVAWSSNMVRWSPGTLRCSAWPGHCQPVSSTSPEGMRTGSFGQTWVIGNG